MEELLAKFPTPDAFWEGLNKDYTATALVTAMAEDFGLACERLPKKRDTFDAAFRLLQEAVAAQAAQAPEPAPSVVQESPEPPGETAPEAGAEGALPPVEAPAPAVRFQIRSRQPEGRWRCQRHWGAPWVILVEEDLLPSEWAELRADPMIEVRELA